MFRKTQVIECQLKQIEALMLKVCHDCGEEFHVVTADSWKTVCRFCYRGEVDARKQLEEAQEELSEMRTLVNKLMSKMDALEARIIDPQRLRQLIQLCHPDKHQGSRSATEVTSWLLSQRQN